MAPIGLRTDVTVVFSFTKTLTRKHSFQLTQAYFNFMKTQKKSEDSKPDQEKSIDKEKFIARYFSSVAR